MGDGGTSRCLGDIVDGNMVVSHRLDFGLTMGGAIRTL